MTSWLPVISTLTWVMLLFPGYLNSSTGIERRVKGALLSYLTVSFFAWISIFVYSYLPIGFVWLNAFAYLSLLLGPVLFYRYIRALTSGIGNDFHFSRYHYLFPVLISIVLLVWSLFVPYEVQLRLVEGRGASYPGWEDYSLLFLSKPLVRLLYNLVYVILSFVQLYKYYSHLRKGTGVGYYPTRWMIVFMTFAATLLLASLVLYFTPRGYLHKSILFSFVNLLFVGQHIIQGYNALSLNFLLYIDHPWKSERGRMEASTKTKRKSQIAERVMSGKKKEAATDRISVAEQINRKQFEAWMRKNKPWLNPGLKITDLLEPLQVNRTYLSGFINKTYGMNFNRYINRCRLEELERLVHLPVNKGKKLQALVGMAGFASMRNYNRALEKASETESDDDD